MVPGIFSTSFTRGVTAVFLSPLLICILVSHVPSPWCRYHYSSLLFVLHHNIGQGFHDLFVSGSPTRSQHEHPPPSLEACSILTSGLHPSVRCWSCIRGFFAQPVSWTMSSVVKLSFYRFVLPLWMPLCCLQSSIFEQLIQIDLLLTY